MTPLERKERQREYLRQWREKNPERFKEIQKRSRTKHAERVKETKKRWRDANPDKVLEQNRRHRQKHPEKTQARDRRPRHNERSRTYKSGMVFAPGQTVDGLIEEQGGLCPVCGRALPPRGPSMHVDHCHETGRVRGVLHRNCNVGIGQLEDNPEFLERAAAYLRRGRPAVVTAEILTPC